MQQSSSESFESIAQLSAGQDIFTSNQRPAVFSAMWVFTC
jgi:hypothetical protein